MMQDEDAIRCSRAGDCSELLRIIFGLATRQWLFPCWRRLFKFWKRSRILDLRSTRMDNWLWRICAWVRVNRHWLMPAESSIWHWISLRRFIPWILDLRLSPRFILNCGEERFTIRIESQTPINIDRLPKKRSNSCAPSKGFSRLGKPLLIIIRAGMNG